MERQIPMIPATPDLNFTGLRYNSFSIVYMQTFGVSECICSKFDSKYIQIDENPIDSQIFVVGEGEIPPVARFKLPPFEIDVHLDEPYPVSVSGTVFVEMSLFFNRTITLTYRLMVNGEMAKASAPLTTDHMIALSALSLGAEHWNSQDDKTPSNINLKLSEVSVQNLLLDENGAWLKIPVSLVPGGKEKRGTPFDEVCRRYRMAVTEGQLQVAFKPLNYIYIDVWENIDNYDGSLQKMEKEEDIITYIFEKCKKEMVGLMTSYPQEWPYRTEEAFKEACGFNIAIDTDDLVLLNTSMCVVFGTYGRRGKNCATDWTRHLEERNRFHVSWPEYMLILEMVLAKKYTIAAAKSLLFGSLKKSSGVDTTRTGIENNARIELLVTELLLRLDAINYSKFMSHKIMFDRTSRRLDIAGDEKALKEVMEKVNNSLSNLSNMSNIKQTLWINIFLASISITALFQVIFLKAEIPLLELIGISKEVGTGIGSILQAFVFLVVFGGIFTIISIVFAQYHLRFIDLFRRDVYKRVFKWKADLSRAARWRQRTGVADREE